MGHLAIALTLLKTGASCSAARVKGALVCVDRLGVPENGPGTGGDDCCQCTLQHKRQLTARKANELDHGSAACHVLGAVLLGVGDLGLGLETVLGPTKNLAKG